MVRRTDGGEKVDGARFWLYLASRANRKHVRHNFNEKPPVELIAEGRKTTN